MHKIIASAALALAVTLTSVPLTLGTASAQDVELYIGNGGPTVRLRDDCNPRREDCRRRDDRDFRRDRDRHRDDSRWGRGCTTENALNKASRMGIRRARVADVGRRSVDVIGRSRSGDRVIVRFDRRDRRCGVIG